MISKTTRLALHAMLGGFLGLASTFIFWLLYFFQEFDAPVSEAIRFRSAFIVTGLIMMCIFLAFNYRWILTQVHNAIEAANASQEEDDEAE